MRLTPFVWQTVSGMWNVKNLIASSRAHFSLWGSRQIGSRLTVRALSRKLVRSSTTIRHSL
jgi:hypothetical protein